MYSRLRCLSPPSSLVFCNRNLGMEQNPEPFVNSQPSKWMVSPRISPSNHGIVFSVLTQLLKSMLQDAAGSLTWKHCLTLPAVCLLAKQKDLLTKTGFLLARQGFQADLHLIRSTWKLKNCHHGHHDVDEIPLRAFLFLHVHRFT